MNLKRVSANTQGRDFVIGDLHGELDQLVEAMAAVAFDQSVDRLFSVGDLIDRGQQSKACFELLREPWFHGVQGNHEELMFFWLESRERYDEVLWMQNGGDAWAEHPEAYFAADPDFERFVLEQMNTLPIAIEVPLRDGRHVGILHACCPVSDWLLLKDALDRIPIREKALWKVVAREIFHPVPCRNIDLTVHGHTMVRHPTRRGNAIYLDTGGCLQRAPVRDAYISDPRLTLMRLEDLFELENQEGP
ncbi:MAG: metallophosphoesterase [Motiliproteus sp.]|nr:metallophosphoesterase [Motiliproteus sp.]MCW9053379.1 metallophosphoesterase [Motiliproteus sp.]